MLKQIIIQKQQQREGGRLTGEEIHQIIKDEFQVRYTHHNSIYAVLKRIGMSWISARSKHPKADKDKQEAFKKLQTRNKAGLT